MPNAFSAVGVGAIFYTPTLPSPLVTWFDDLAIDDTQIGATRPAQARHAPHPAFDAAL